MVEQRDSYELIVKVPYAGPATLGVILAVTGDVSRFSNYRKGLHRLLRRIGDIADH